MRLINARTLRLEDFTHKKVPPYVVLSHTWDDEEVSFQDMRDAVPNEEHKWAKITQTCRLTRKNNLRYAWVDTCCIDKTSSAELTESINSMYRWYAESQLCLVHLSDLIAGDAFIENVNHCRWRTRGWTLQELIAPKLVEFYNSEWKLCGSKAQHATPLSTLIGIPTNVLSGKEEVTSFSVAQRMSWAAMRQTTRMEDIAYCLLGIFDVNMPLIYGEGRKAFRRLQQAIIAQSNDLTILAWHWSGSSEIKSIHGLLAPSPLEFLNSISISPPYEDFHEFATTNKGLSIRGDVAIRPIQLNASTSEGYGLRVGWRRKGDGDFQIALRRVGPTIFCRDHNLEHTQSRSHSTWDGPYFYLEDIHILEATLSISVESLCEQFRRWSLHIPKPMGYRVLDVRPRQLWDSSDTLFLRPRPNHRYPYPKVLAVLFQSTATPSPSISGRFGVICDYRGNKAIPYLFSSKSHGEIEAVIFGDSTRSASMHWEELQRHSPRVAELQSKLDLQQHGLLVGIEAKVQDCLVKFDNCSRAVNVSSLELVVSESLLNPAEIYASIC